MDFGRRWLMPLSTLLLLFLTMSECAAPVPSQEDAVPATPQVPVSSLTPQGETALAQSDLERESAPQVSQADLSLLAKGNAEFAFDLYQAHREQSGNLFFSPFSITAALAMVFAGARHETERQMAQTLHFTLPQERLHPALNALALMLEPSMDDLVDTAFEIRLANSLWGQEGFEYRTEFLDLIATNYGAGLRLVDYVNDDQRELARLAINQWVSDQTEGRIEELIQEGILTPLTRLVLANAIYFEAEWEIPFLSGTTDADFALLDGSHKSVPLMSRRAATAYSEGTGYQAVEIPYTGDRAAMIVILPQQGQFEAVEESWGPDLVQEISQGLVRTDVRLYLPRFEYGSEFYLNPALEDLGMPDAFDPNKADFTGITVHPEPKLFIRHVVHKAFVAVDEMGTEAAASTAVVEEIESMPLVVRIDRPFLFFIHDRESDTILFIGRVLDPGS